MAAASGRGDRSVAAALLEEPYRFGFFQAVRLLRLWSERDSSIGRAAGKSRHDALQFRTPLTLSFPASEIQDLQLLSEPADGSNWPRQTMTVAFLGLTGPQGVLPYHYTEMLIEQSARHRDKAAHDFFDLFNHRLISLFYAAWEKYHLVVPYERKEGDRLLQYLLAFIGLGTPGLRNRLVVDGAGPRDEMLGYYSGLLSQRRRSASGLAAILADDLGLAVKIEQFRGSWLIIGAGERTRLGRGGANGANNRLGDNAMIGDRAWDRQSSFRIVLGPVSIHQFWKLLPDKPGFQAIVRLVRFYVGVGFSFDIQLILRKDEVPAFRLDPPGKGMARLGWSCWIARPPFKFTEDKADAVFAVGSEARIT